MTAAPVVFVVDDDASVRSSLKFLLSTVGLQAETLDSADSFLHKKRPDVPSCLVLDVRLPGLSGLDFQRELAARNICIPIVFLTGHGDALFGDEEGGKSGLQGDTVPVNGRRGRPQGKCHRKHTAEPARSRMGWHGRQG